MKCEKCNGWGFIELEHGLVMVECRECNGTGEVEETEQAVIACDDKDESLRPDIPEGEIKVGIIMGSEEGQDDISSGTGQPDKPTGSTDTSKPVKRKKPKAKKKSRKRTRKVLP